jgi:hypothetical protein
MEKTEAFIGIGTLYSDLNFLVIKLTESSLTARNCELPSEKTSVEFQPWGKSFRNMLGEGWHRS